MMFYNPDQYTEPQEGLILHPCRRARIQPKDFSPSAEGGSSWRPDDWEKIVAMLLESPRDEVSSEPGESYDVGFQRGIEAGADAMLKALYGKKGRGK